MRWGLGRGRVRAPAAVRARAATWVRAVVRLPVEVWAIVVPGWAPVRERVRVAVVGAAGLPVRCAWSAVVALRWWTRRCPAGCRRWCG